MRPLESFLLTDYGRTEVGTRDPWWIPLPLGRRDPDSDGTPLSRGASVRARACVCECGPACASERLGMSVRVHRTPDPLVLSGEVVNREPSVVTVTRRNDQGGWGGPPGYPRVGSVHTPTRWPVRTKGTCLSKSDGWAVGVCVK